MGWRSDFGFLNAAMQSGYVGSRPTYERPQFRPQSSRDFDAWAIGGSRPTSLWGQAASGALARPDPVKPKPAGPPERFDVSIPASSLSPAQAEAAAAPTAPRSTQGDFLGSFGDAIGSSLSHLDLGNAIPWFMERMTVASNALADELDKNNLQVVGAPFRGIGMAGDAFLGAVKGASDAIAPVLEALPNYYRDTQLADRAKVYRAIVTGKPVDMPGFLSGNFIPGSTAGANQLGIQYEIYRRYLEQSIDPREKEKAALAIRVLRDSIDLPESVKLGLEHDPNADVNKLLDAAPEGRQFSYDPGLSGAISNAGYPLFFYGAEAVAAFRWAGGLRAGLVGSRTVGGNAALALEGAGGAPAVGINSVAGGLGQGGIRGAAALSRALQAGVSGTARGLTMAAKLQTYATAAGVGYQAIATTMDGIARYQGYEAAIQWFDRVNRTTKISDDPRVQLVTGFSVNPFGAVGLAKKGIVRLGSGIGDVTIGRALGTRFTRYYTHSDLMYEQIRKMYRLGSVDEARAFVAKHYDSPGEAFDEVVGVALDAVLDRLPKEERLAFVAQHTDPVERTRVALRTYGRQTMDMLEKESDVVAARWNQHSWEYHQYPGPFNAEVAALNARDYRQAMKRTFDMRSRLDAVVGYTELIPPRGQALVEEWLGRAADPDGKVAVAGVDGVQDLVRQFPAMRKYLRGMVPGGATHVDRSVVAAALEQAKADYAVTVRQNPVRARTGADPVLRPDSPRMIADYAEALGTTQETVRALSDFNLSKPNAEHVNLLRQFLVEKVGIDPELAASIAPDEVWGQAGDYVERVTAPWVQAGQAVAGAERRIGVVKAELARLAGIPERARLAPHADQVARLERELADLNELLRTAADPIRPFSEEVVVARGRKVSARRIREMDPENLSAADRTYLRRYLDDQATGGLSNADLHARALERVQSGSGRIASPTESHLAEMALRKVEALETLRQLDAIDGQAQSMLNPTYAADDWHRMISKTPEGEWSWSGGADPVTRSMRLRLQAWARKQGGVVRSSAPAITESMGDAELWQWIRNNPGALEQLTTQQRRYFAAARKGHAIDEAAGDYMAGSGESADLVIERLAHLREAREDLLAGRYEHNVRRQGAADVPPVYLREAEAAFAGRELYYDAEFDAVIHPQNIAEAQAILSNPEELYIGLRSVVDNDQVMRRQVEALAREQGVPVSRILHDPAFAPKVKSAIIPPDFEPPIAGSIPEATELDFLIRAEDAPALSRLSQQLAEARSAPADPLNVPLSEAQAVGAGATVADLRATLEGDAIRPGQVAESQRVNADLGIQQGGTAESGGAVRERPRVEKRIRPSSQYREDLVGAGADLTAAPDEAILTNPANKIGVDVLSVLNHGTLGTKPATINGVLSLLREIENGNAARMGVGPALQAEAQRVARDLLRAARNQARREGIPAGVYTKGIDPAMMAEDDLILARTLEGTIDPRTGRPKKGGVPLMQYDPADPLGSLQYGLKKRPRDAVVLEWAQVPGLAEEFLASNFKPWEERVWNAHARQAFNWIFGPRTNAAIAAETRQRFVDRLGRLGVDQGVATAVWERWKKIAHDSRETEVRKVPLERITPEGPAGPHPAELAYGGKPVRSIREHVAADNPLYADVRNIPTSSLDRYAHEAIDEILRAEQLPASYRNVLKSIDYGGAFREASSHTRRFLADAPIPLGDKLAAMYGAVTQNRWVTTMYYFFRFGLDLRYHAMNYFESQILYAGRAGLRHGELDEGLLGATEGYLRNLDFDPANNTGYATSRSRMAYAYRTFLKEQPGALRQELRGIAAEDPQLMEAAMRDLARHDPELSKTILLMGDDVDRYLGKMDEWYRKMLRNVDEAGDAATIEDAIVRTAEGRDPAMAEVYGRLAKVNADLWSNVRETFYGKADRSRAERTLNSWLLFWPLSYQVKAAKWLMRVMYDRAGGLPTNAAGAVMVDRLIETHNRLLSTDSEYRDWYEKHPTLTFVAQMFVPITWDSMGVSLNPVLRDIFFERQKSVFEIGPIYTVNKVVKPLLEEAYVDLYPTLKDVPAINGIYSALTGKKPPKAPVDDLASASQQ